MCGAPFRDSGPYTVLLRDHFTASDKEKKGAPKGVRQGAVVFNIKDFEMTCLGCNVYGKTQNLLSKRILFWSSDIGTSPFLVLAF